MSFPLGHNTTKGLTTHTSCNVNKAIGHAAHTDPTVYATTLAGDPTKLRGIPAIGRNVAGAITGTSPHATR